MTEIRPRYMARPREKIMDKFININKIKTRIQKNIEELKKERAGLKEKEDPDIWESDDFYNGAISSLECLNEFIKEGNENHG